MRGESKAQRQQDRERKSQSGRYVHEPRYIRHMHPAQARVAGINSALGLRVCQVLSLALVFGGLD